MEFQFTEVANIQEQIKQLTEQLNNLTQAIAPYTESQKEANWLVEKVGEHRIVMESKGIAPSSLHDWAIALFEAACDHRMEINIGKDLEIERLKSVLQEKEAITNAERDRLNNQIDDLDNRLTDALVQAGMIQEDYAEMESSYLSAMEELKEFSSVRLAMDETEVEENGDRKMEINIDKDLEIGRLKSVLQEKEAIEDRDSSRVTPFSNGTEYVSWNNRNCDRCEHSMNCRIAEAIDAASDGDGTISAEIAREAGATHESKRWIFPLNCSQFKIEDEPSPTTSNENTENCEFPVGAIVQCQDGTVGTVAFVPSPYQGLVSVRMASGNNANLHAKNLKQIASVENTETEGAEVHAEKKTDKVAELLNFGKGDAKKLKEKMEAITWNDIAEACDRKPLLISKLIGDLARSRSQIRKDLGERIEYLLAIHVAKSGDRSDLAIVPMGTKLGAERLIKESQESPAEVEALEEAPKFDCEWIGDIYDAAYGCKGVAIGKVFADYKIRWHRQDGSSFERREESDSLGWLAVESAA
jgi:hypothetical protein